MMLYEGDVRRCRRCKRRRMDDEPPEVQQYKTCAKCRIIERTKKKLRKPLAEETMRYGMRQFQEQNQNANFIHDDIFANDSLLSDIQTNKDVVPNPLKQLYNTQFAVYKQPALQYGTQAPPTPAAGGNYNYSYQTNPGYQQQSMRATPAYNGVALGGLSAFDLPQLGTSTPHGVPVARPGVVPGAVTGAPSAAAATAIAAASINRGDLQGAGVRQTHYKAYPKQHGDRSRLALATHCELCQTKLDPEDSVSGMYRLCQQCYLDPYARENVLKDFNDFLLEVVNNKDQKSLTYILELAPYLVELLNTNRSISSEEQFRKVMLDSFGLIYMDPLMALLAPTKFTRVLHNIAEVNHTVPEVSKVSHQYHYTLTLPLRTSYVGSNEVATTTLDLFFLTETNLIIIKKISKKTAADYSVAFLKSLDVQMRARGLTFEDDAIKVFATVKPEVEADQFVKDFKLIQKQIYNVRKNEAVAASLNGHLDANNGDLRQDESHLESEGDSDKEKDDEDDEDDEDEDEDDMDEDDEEDGDPDELDPMFAP